MNAIVSNVEIGLKRTDKTRFSVQVNVRLNIIEITTTLNICTQQRSISIGSFVMNAVKDMSSTITPNAVDSANLGSVR